MTSEAAHAEGIDIVELPLMHLMYECMHDSSSYAASREKANREKARESKCTGGALLCPTLPLHSRAAYTSGHPMWLDSSLERPLNRSFAYHLAIGYERLERHSSVSRSRRTNNKDIYLLVNKH